MSHYFKNDSSIKERDIKIPFTYQGNSFLFESNNGIFSKDEIDVGSKTLLDELMKLQLYGKLLDVGCGYGLLGVVLKKNNPELDVMMVDVNDRAVELALLNAKNNGIKAKIKYSDSYSIINEKFDWIISNPPIRAGKIVVNEILTGAINYLDDGGSLVIVMRKSHGAKSAIALLESVFKEVSILKRNKGFYVIKANK